MNFEGHRPVTDWSVKEFAENGLGQLYPVTVAFVLCDRFWTRKIYGGICFCRLKFGQPMLVMHYTSKQHVLSQHYGKIFRRTHAKKRQANGPHILLYHTCIVTIIIMVICDFDSSTFD